MIRALGFAFVGLIATSTCAFAEVKLSSKFIDKTPATPKSVLLQQGWRDVAHVYVRGRKICRKQIAYSGFAPGLILLKNDATGEKAICCLIGGSIKRKANTACRPVAKDFVLGPDIFSGEVFE